MSEEIKVNGIEMILDQNAYADGTNEDPHFTALAHDADENKYLVRWDIDPDYDDPDGNGVRDWDKPSDAELIKKGHIAVVDENAIDELNKIAREGVRVLKPGELRDWLADEADNYDAENGGQYKYDSISKLWEFVDNCINMPYGDIIDLLDGDGYGVDVNNCIPVVMDDANLDGVYIAEELGDTPSRELFTDRIKADQLIANVPLYDVTVDGKQIITLGDGFHWDDGELLWQAMSEELTDLVPDGDDDRLNDWQNLPDDDIETLLQSAKEEGFISDYDIDEL
ncbi:hypothetical protein [Limosilactobacillus mucosae]|uniref:hypothetical protein n=1 Tax=Limosilactobacillus mucosae TaxID=97478 RepID=UPI000FFC1BD1|nr:hypothetical protein [Limosilactobacillus mucosae]RXA58127.1 hypothetical protein EQ839_02740 [Limosilactobacillus mucosae]